MSTKAKGIILSVLMIVILAILTGCGERYGFEGYKIENDNRYEIQAIAFGNTVSVKMSIVFKNESEANLFAKVFELYGSDSSGGIDFKPSVKGNKFTLSGLGTPKDGKDLKSTLDEIRKGYEEDGYILSDI